MSPELYPLGQPYPNLLNLRTVVFRREESVEGRRGMGAGARNSGVNNVGPGGTDTEDCGEIGADGAT